MSIIFNCRKQTNKDTKTVSHIPFKNIRYSIQHLMIRDNFHIIYTKDQLHTAQILSEMVSYYDVLIQKNIIEGGILGGDSTESLRKRYLIDNKKYAVNILAVIPGISQHTATLLLDQRTLKDIFTMTVDQIEELRVFDKKITKACRENLKKLEVFKVRILGACPGFSNHSARYILQDMSLEQLIKMPLKTKKELKYNDRQLGSRMEKLETILNFL